MTPRVSTARQRPKYMQDSRGEVVYRRKMCPGPRSMARRPSVISAVQVRNFLFGCSQHVSLIPPMRRLFRLACVMTLSLTSAPAVAQSPDWSAVARETVEHLQRMIRINTVNPPGNELGVAQ